MHGAGGRGTTRVHIMGAARKEVKVVWGKAGEEQAEAALGVKAR